MNKKVEFALIGAGIALILASVFILLTTGGGTEVAATNEEGVQEVREAPGTQEEMTTITMPGTSAAAAEEGTASAADASGGTAERSRTLTALENSVSGQASSGTVSGVAGSAGTGASGTGRSGTRGSGAGTSSGAGVSGTGTLTARSSTPSVSGNELYRAPAYALRDEYRQVVYSTERQLEEMTGYWAAGDLAAVEDLARLDRFEAMSYQVKAGVYLYHGEKDSSGRPDGKGLAVYANNCYYYGDWVAGERSGTGEWIQFYPENAQSVVVRHMYRGGFRDNLPDGEGHENFVYDRERMDPASWYPQNVIGTFTKGYYDGDMYLIIEEPDGNLTEWRGTCEMGKWVQIAPPEGETSYPVLKKEADREEKYIKMTDETNRDYKVLHLK